jgi:hypothetical protein
VIDFGNGPTLKEACSWPRDDAARKRLILDVVERNSVIEGLTPLDDETCARLLGPEGLASTRRQGLTNQVCHRAVIRPEGRSGRLDIPSSPLVACVVDEERSSGLCGQEFGHQSNGSSVPLPERMDGQELVLDFTCRPAERLVESDNALILSASATNPTGVKSGAFCFPGQRDFSGFVPGA